MPSDQVDEVVDQIREFISADEWNAEAEDHFPMELPSGKWVGVRRSLDLMAFLVEGHIPNPLREIVVKMMDKAKAVPQGAPVNVEQDMSAVAEDPLALRQFGDLLNKITCKVMVHPPVSMPTPRGELPEMPDETQDQYDQRINAWRPDPGTVSIFVIDLADKMFLFAVAQGAVADLKSFRQQQEGAVPAASTGEGVRSAPKRPVGATKRTGGTGKRPAKKAAAKKQPAKKSAGAKKKAAPRKSSAAKKRA